MMLAPTLPWRQPAPRCVLSAGAAALIGLIALGTAPAAAQYKVVLPNGSVTYTDRPPVDASARVTPLSRSATAPTPESTLPPELRQATQRYPVALYTSTGCTPCDNGRRFLQRRGVPYNEFQISSEEDSAALERAVGGRTVPALTVGPQPLRGFSESDWASFLDAAGYPRSSRLPRDWPLPVAAPLVARSAPPALDAAGAGSRGAPAAVLADPRSGEAVLPGGLRF